jgi:hypothetical protein
MFSAASIGSMTVKSDLYNGVDFGCLSILLNELPV